MLMSVDRPAQGSILSWVDSDSLFSSCNLIAVIDFAS